MTLMTEPIIIGVDPHKKSRTAVAVDRSGHQLADVRVPANTAGYRRLRRFSNRYPEPAWARGGAYGLGSTVAALLTADGFQILDVPANSELKLLTEHPGWACQVQNPGQQQAPRRNDRFGPGRGIPWTSVLGTAPWKSKSRRLTRCWMV